MTLWSTNEHLHAADMLAGIDPRTGGYIDDDYLIDLEKTSPDLFKDKPDPTGDKKWKPKPGTDPLTGLPLAKTRPELESDDYRMRREQMNRGKKQKIDPTDVYEPPDPGLDPLTGIPLAKGREPNKEDAPYRPKPPGGPPWPGYPNPMPPGTPTKLALNTSEDEDAELYKRYKELQDPQAPSEEDLINPPIELAGNPYGLSDDDLFRRKTLQDIINDPNTDKDTLKEAQKQWLLLPPIDLAQGQPPVMGERDAVIQRADALRKAGKINEALDLYRHAAKLPTPQV